MEARLRVVGAKVDDEYRMHAVNSPKWATIEAAVVYRKGMPPDEENPMVMTPIGSLFTFTVGEDFMREFSIGREFSVKLEPV